MENQRTYNLRGLLLVFWGLLLEFLICGIGGAVSSVVSNTMGEGISSGNLATVILVIAVLVFTLMIIAGLSRVKSYSDKFRKARNYYIWNILLALLAGAVVFVGAFLILGSMDDNGNTTMPKETGLVIVTVAVVLSVISAVIHILCIKNLMGGCAQIAMAHEEKKYSRKCTRTWVEYVVLTVAAVVLGLMALISGGKGLIQSISEHGGTIRNISDMAGNMDNALILIGGAILCMILLVVVYIGAIARVHGTYSRFNKIPLPGQEPEETEVAAGLTEQSATGGTVSPAPAAPARPAASAGTVAAAQRPAQPRQEQRPAQPRKGQSPAQPRQGQRPAQPQQGQSPAQPRQGQRPAQPQQGQRPAQPQKGSGKGSLPDLPDIPDISDGEDGK